MYICRKSELKRLFYKLNLPVTDEDLDNIIGEADLDKDGKIDFKGMNSYYDSVTFISGPSSVSRRGQIKR